jgi:murein L,D-transpeptidase YafK
MGIKCLHLQQLLDVHGTYLVANSSFLVLLLNSQKISDDNLRVGKRKVMKLIVLLALVLNVALAENFYPKNILMLDSKFSHHVALVEKSTHTLYLYKNDNTGAKLVKKYQVATGKYEGNKYVEGDRKTPEGIYLLERFLSHEEIVKMYGEKQAAIYGAGAFTSNYPNIIDKRAGKGGGGIWIHSTDDNTRVSKGLDSRGCVVVVDDDLKDLSKYIDLQNTPMIVVQNISFIKEDTFNTLKNKIVGAVNDWQDAWMNKDFKRYISHYHQEKFFNKHRGNYAQFKTYKRAVFARADKPVISFSNMSVLVHDEYAVVQLEQDYKSPVVDDVGKKTLYLQRDKDYKWKIVAEQWRKLSPENRNIAFVPPNEIL